VGDGWVPGGEHAYGEWSSVDVFVDLKDGSRWSATIITLAQVEILLKRWAVRPCFVGLEAIG
jgi:hypothetical protein